MHSFSRISRARFNNIIYIYMFECVCVGAIQVVFTVHTYISGFEPIDSTGSQRKDS